MKISLETGMNDDGSERSKPLASVFLSQRKWVIACASFVFLVSNGFISLNQKWLLFLFSIDYSATKLLRSVSVAGLLFAIYMVFSGYAFFKKYRIEQQELFAGLGVSERDVYSAQIAELNKQRDELEPELTKRIQQVEDSAAEVQRYKVIYDELRTFEAELKLDRNAKVPDSLHTVLSRGKKSPTNAFAPSQGLTPEEVEYSGSIILSIYQDKVDDLGIKKESERVLRGDLQGIVESISEAEKSRSKVMENNASEWKRFYRSRILSDATSLVPTFLAAAYCGYFLCVSFHMR